MLADAEVTKTSAERVLEEIKETKRRCLSSTDLVDSVRYLGPLPRTRDDPHSRICFLKNLQTKKVIGVLMGNDDRATLDPEIGKSFARWPTPWSTTRSIICVTCTSSKCGSRCHKPARTSFDEPLPEEGIDAARAYCDFKDRVRPYTNGNIHPRLCGWVQGTGNPLSMIAEMLGAALRDQIEGGTRLSNPLLEHPRRSPPCHGISRDRNSSESSA